MLDANKCFEKQAHSGLSLQLAAYYYALQIYTRLAPCFKDKTNALYQVSSRPRRHVLPERFVLWQVWDYCCGRPVEGYP